MPRPPDALIVIVAGAAALATIALGIAVSVVYAGVNEYQQQQEIPPTHEPPHSIILPTPPDRSSSVHLIV